MPPTRGYPWRRYRRRARPAVEAFYNTVGNRYLRTPSGLLSVGPGDVVVRDEAGGPWRVVAAQIFEELYEPIEE